MADDSVDLARRYRLRPAPGTDPRYSVFDRAHLLAGQQRERILIRELDLAGVRDLGNLEILDVGCGQGLELLRFALWGARPERLHGIDLLPERVAMARQLHPAMEIVEGNATQLPWPADSFDLVTQFTAFSSILDAGVRQRVAGEMARVLRRSGCIVWYDFWLNPVNRDTRGVVPREIRALFPGFDGRLRRLTLAPPLARRLAPRSVVLASLLQGLPFLQTHYLGVLRKRG